MNSKINLKLLVISMSVALLSLSQFSHALVINNYNKYDAAVEIMDCPSTKTYGFPLKWVNLCINNISPNRADGIEFLYNGIAKSGDRLIMDKYFNPSTPTTVCVLITGKTGYMVSKVKSSCELSVYDNGFNNGIRIEYNQDCNSQ